MAMSPMYISTDTAPTAAALEASELQGEFRTLTMLVTLVSAMNDKFNRSTLPQTSFNGAEAVEPLQPTTRRLALNAIATILVRDDEIIAASGSLLPPANALNHPDPRVLVVLQNQPQAMGRHSANPDTNNFPFDQFVFAPTGRSHWPSVLKNCWHGLNIR
jgi:hypothetical protein